MRTGTGKKPQLKSKTPSSNSTPPKNKAGNFTTDLVGSLPFQNLKVRPDKMDKKAPEISTTLIPSLEQGVVGIAPKHGIPKLDMVPKEQDKMVVWELRMQIEEAKYKLYLGQLSTEESDMETETDGSDYPFLD